MVFFLLLSILSSAALLIVLKSFIRWRVETMHGIIFNYWTAASLAYFFGPDHQLDIQQEIITVLPATTIIGFLFISVFFITAKTTQQMGVAVASVASKMSMVIPISAGIIMYDESLGVMKLAGLALALPAVIITSYPSRSNVAEQKFDSGQLMLPLLLFFGAGIVDAAIKYSQHHFMNEQNQHIIIMTIFASAGVFGLLRLLYELILLKKSLHARSIMGGILLGTVNYFSLYFLLKCLASPGAESSTVFAYVNIGVVITSFITGLLMFGEKADRNKIIGILLAVSAIIILATYTG